MRAVGWERVFVLYLQASLVVPGPGWLCWRELGWEVVG